MCRRLSQRTILVCAAATGLIGCGGSVGLDPSGGGGAGGSQGIAGEGGEGGSAPSPLDAQAFGEGGETLCGVVLGSPLVPESEERVRVRSVAVDAKGQAFVTGLFSGVIDFGQGHIASTGEDDLFVAAYDSACGLLWFAHGSGARIEEGNAIAVGPDGRVWVGGRFQDTLTIAGETIEEADPGNTTIGAAFLAAWENDGTFIGHQAFDNALGANVTAVSVSSAGQIVLGGQFSWNLTLGDADLIGGERSAFVASLDPAGSVAWSRALAAAPDDLLVGDLSLAAGADIVVGGLAEGDIELGDTALALGPSGDAFVGVLDANGAPQWGRGFATESNELWGAHVAQDGQGRVAFARTSLAATDVPAAMFVHLEDKDGSEIWAKKVAQHSLFLNARVAFDAEGNILVAGFLHGTANFGGGNLTFSGALSAPIVAKLSPTGDHLFSRKLGASFATATGLAAAPSGAIAVAGEISGQVDVGGAVLDGDGIDNSYLLWLSP